MLLFVSILLTQEYLIHIYNNKMIRAYQTSDTTAVVHVWRQAATIAHNFLGEAFLAQEQKDLQEIYLPSPNSLTWVFEQDDHVVGFISMLGHEIGGLFVLPEQQRLGIGSALIHHVKAEHTMLEVDVFQQNQTGRAFYQKYGFTVYDQYVFEPCNEMMLKMRYIVSPPTSGNS